MFFVLGSVVGVSATGCVCLKHRAKVRIQRESLSLSLQAQPSHVSAQLQLHLPAAPAASCPLKACSLPSFSRLDILPPSAPSLRLTVVVQVSDFSWYSCKLQHQLTPLTSYLLSPLVQPVSPLSTF